MAIVLRRGNKTDLNTSALEAGELAVATDTGELWAKLTPTAAKQVATLADGALPVSNGGTGATTASAARSALGVVPSARQICGKALTADITLSAADVGASPVLKAENFSASINNSASVSVPITVPTGYDWLCWVNVCTSGFVGSPYIATDESTPTSAKIYLSSNGTGTIMVTALFVKLN